MEKILTTVVGTPEFATLYAAPGKPFEKGEQALALVPENMKKNFQRLVPIRQDRVDLFANIIKSRGNQETLMKAIEDYLSKPKDGNVNALISDEASAEGLAKSVDALTGKFESEMERAIAQGQAPAQKKWGRLIKTLKNAIEQVKSGEKPKITRALAQQHAGVLGRLKKELGQ